MRLIHRNTLVATLLCAGASVAGAQTVPTLLYGTSTSVVSGAPFALASTQPASGQTRSKYIAVAEKDASANLRVLAWQDTTSALQAISHYGTLVVDGGLAGFAATGLDDEHVVTAAIDAKGALFIDTWTVATSGVTLLHAYRTGIGKASNTVSITRAGATRVVVAFATPSGTLDVEAYAIASNGAATPETSIGTGPSVTQIAIAAVDPNLIITSSGDGAGTLYVNTWQVNSGGVTSSDSAVFSGTVNTSPQAVAVGGGGATDSNGNLVHSAFTPFISPDDQLDVFYWSVSTTGVLTQQTTPASTQSGEFYSVAAAMLPSNVPMTSFGGGTGDNYLFAEWYTGPYETPAQFSGNPAGVSSIASVAEGRNAIGTGKDSDFFVSAASYNQLNPSPNGTLYLEVFSVPDSNPDL